MVNTIDTGDSPLYGFMRTLLDHQPQLEGSHFITKILRSGQARFYKNYDGYPQNIITPEAWEHCYNWLYSPEQSYLAGQFEVDIRMYPLLSNVSERYKSPSALAAIMHKLGRFATFSMVDIGSGQLAGLKHIASEYPFGPVRAIRAGSRSQSSHAYQGHAFDRLANRRTPLGQLIGVDQYDPLVTRDLAYAYSFNPSELLDPGKVALFDALLSRTYEHVKFFRGDFTKFREEDGERFDSQFGDIEAAFYNFSTVLYQWDEPHRDLMLSIARERAQEAVVVTDFLRIDPANPTQLIFRNNWDPQDITDFPYATVFWDQRARHPHWQIAFEWRDGRADELRVGRGRLVADDEGHKISIFKIVNELAEAIKRNPELKL